MSYQGTLYDERFEQGKKPVEITVFHGNLLIARDDAGSFEFDLKKAEFVLGGFENNIIYIYPDSQTKTPALLVNDLRLLDELRASASPEVRDKAMLVAAGRKKKKTARVVGIAVIVALFAGLILVATTQASNLVVKMVPTKWDEKLGEVSYPSAVGSLAPGSSKIEDKYVMQSIAEIQKKLTGALQKSPFKYEVTILKSPVENAFALPGGKIVVFTGILLKVDSAEEFAGILAHEIMHAEKRHAMRQIVSRLGLTALLQVLIGDFASAGGVILEVGSELISLGYSRSMESEADKEAIRLLSAAGIPADGLIAFFQKISKDEKGLKSMQWLLTHPLSEKRAETLAEIYKKNKPARIDKFAINWKDIKARLK